MPLPASALSDDSYRAAHGAAPGPTYVDAVATPNPLNEKPSLREPRRPRGRRGIREMVHCHRRAFWCKIRNFKEIRFAFRILAFTLCWCPLVSCSQGVRAGADASGHGPLCPLCPLRPLRPLRHPRAFTTVFSLWEARRFWLN